MTAAPRQFKKLSVAIPVFNEERVLPHFYDRLTAVLDALPAGPHEIVFVDDGSRDGSLELLEAFARVDPRVRVVMLSRNFGHQAAISAALDHTTGDVVVVMDADLQDTPETIPQFLEKYVEGYDVVYAVRHERKEAWLLRTCYAAFYRLIKSLADIDLPLGAGDFALLSRRVVDQLCNSAERNRYLRGLRTWVGFPQTGIVVERAARAAGESKYTPRKLVKLALDGIFSFSTAPLRAATVLGAATIAASLSFAAFTLYQRVFLGHAPAGFTALVLGITFLSGVQLLFLGVIGEYVGRVYEEVKRRPHYLVDRVITADSIDEEYASGVAAKGDAKPAAARPKRKAKKAAATAKRRTRTTRS
ncbi:MAG: glycosyltransferase family 2 protein [Pirellulales bacterium]